jgi:hypothetical protein
MRKLYLFALSWLSFVDSLHLEVKKKNQYEKETQRWGYFKNNFIKVRSHVVLVTLMLSPLTSC